MNKKFIASSLRLMLFNACSRHGFSDMATMAGEYTSVKDFYRDRSIFITGGTGFMGKVLVEKLLRSCPDIKNIYLLIRPKKGQDVQQRLQELLNAPVIVLSFPSSTCYVYIWEINMTLSSTVIPEIKTGFSGRPFEDRTYSRRRDGTRTGHLGGRSGHVDTIGIHRFPFSGHRQIRRGSEALSHHKHVGHQKIDSIMPSYAQRGGKRGDFFIRFMFIPLFDLPIYPSRQDCFCKAKLTNQREAIDQQRSDFSRKCSSRKIAECLFFYKRFISPLQTLLDSKETPMRRIPRESFESESSLRSLSWRTSSIFN